MQEINPAVLDAAFYNFDLRYQAGYERTPTWTEMLATVVPSGGREMHYGWMKVLPRFREWIGARVVNGIASRGYVLPNKKYELTVGVDRVDIEDDQIGLYGPKFEMLGASSKKWSDDVLAPIIQAGTTGLCFDGQPYFSASHPYDMDNPASSTYSNYNASGKTLTATNYGAVRAQMRSFLADDSKPLNINPDTLFVPPQLEETGLQILNADFIAPAAAFGQNAAGGMQSNTLKGSAKLVVIPEFANDPTGWYLADTSKPIKPFVWQVRKPPELTPLVDPSSPNVFNEDQYVYGMYARGNGGYALPFLCVYSKT